MRPSMQPVGGRNTLKNGSRILGLICARGSSKGVPRKNLRLLQGKPLIAYAIEVALSCPSIDQTVVTTEDLEIADEARRGVPRSPS